MNRLLWFRILQVAVAAPWLFQVSKKADNAYFEIGLKMIAVNIVILNAPYLITAAQEAMKVYEQMQQGKVAPTTVTATPPPVLLEQSLTV